jgi:hypothetical protein
MHGDRLGNLEADAIRRKGERVELRAHVVQQRIVVERVPRQIDGDLRVR